MSSEHRPPLGVAAELELEVIDRLPGGEHAAWAVRDRAGGDFVLKVFAVAERSRLELAVSTALRVRERGVPVPSPYRAGATATHAYTLQAFCPGQIAEWLTDAHARQLVNFWDAHLDAVPEGSDWPERAVGALCHGDWELFAAHEPVRAAGGAPAELLEEIIAVGKRADPACLRRTDAMHGDWHHRNLLADGDTITAIIDWENARPGDARLDLVLLNFWTSVWTGSGVMPDAAMRIRTAAEQRVVPEARAVLSALVALHQLWFVCAYRHERIDDTVAFARTHLVPGWSATP